MFYDRYVLLCNKAGKKPYEVARELGFGNSNVAQWKKGSTPRRDSVKLIADYFGVSIAYLLTGEEQKNAPTAESSESEVDMKLREFARSASPEELLELHNYIEFIKSKRK